LQVPNSGKHQQQAPLASPPPPKVTTAPSKPTAQPAVVTPTPTPPPTPEPVEAPSPQQHDEEVDGTPVTTEPAEDENSQFAVAPQGDQMAGQDDVQEESDLGEHGVGKSVCSSMYIVCLGLATGILAYSFEVICNEIKGCSCI
jgi:hypothetical protein